MTTYTIVYNLNARRNSLSNRLSDLNALIYSNHGNFSDDEYKSLCGTAFHIYTNLRTECDHLEKVKPIINV